MPAEQAVPAWMMTWSPALNRPFPLNVRLAACRGSYWIDLMATALGFSTACFPLLLVGYHGDEIAGPTLRAGRI